MKKVLILAVLVFLGVAAFRSFGGSSGAGTQSPAGAAAGPAEKLTLLDFTGSDWCGWCQKLDREVFSQPEFQQFARRT